MKKEYTFRIQPQEVDFRYKATIAALTNVLLTTAGYNADENGFGIRKLNEIDCSWVLLRLAVEMVRFPEQYEDISVETWVEDVGRASTKRNFIIRDADKNEIGRAVSMWAMINIQTRRAQDLSVLEGIQQHANGISIDMENPVKLNSVSATECQSFDVKYSHIDINGHVSSMRYLEWVCDCLSPEFYLQKSVSRFEVNYLSEIRFGENVKVKFEEISENDFRFEILKGNSSACKARIVFYNN